MMKCLGFEKLKERWKVGGKMVYWLFRKVKPADSEESAYKRKSILRSGKARNNFAILL
jgi:25S rRNA (adenine2142-N1)-methyltransferase